MLLCYCLQDWALPSVCLCGVACSHMHESSHFVHTSSHAGSLSHETATQSTRRPSKSSALLWRSTAVAARGNGRLLDVIVFFFFFISLPLGFFFPPTTQNFHVEPSGGNPFFVTFVTLDLHTFSTAAMPKGLCTPRGS
jgi:hypothetical protein